MPNLFYIGIGEWFRDGSKDRFERQLLPVRMPHRNVPPFAGFGCEGDAHQRGLHLLDGGSLGIERDDLRFAERRFQVVQLVDCVHNLSGRPADRAHQLHHLRGCGCRDAALAEKGELT